MPVHPAGRLSGHFGGRGYASSPGRAVIRPLRGPRLCQFTRPGGYPATSGAAATGLAAQSGGQFTRRVSGYHKMHKWLSRGRPTAGRLSGHFGGRGDWPSSAIRRPVHPAGRLSGLKWGPRRPLRGALLGQFLDGGGYPATSGAAARPVHPAGRLSGHFRAAATGLAAQSGGRAPRRGGQFTRPGGYPATSGAAATGLAAQSGGQFTRPGGYPA